MKVIAVLIILQSNETFNFQDAHIIALKVSRIKKS